MNLVSDDVFFNELTPILQCLCQVGSCDEFSAFARFLLARVAAAELRPRHLERVAGNLYSLWCQFQKLPLDRPLIRVFNPDLISDCWDSPHTVVHVITANSPFLVDSITNQLSRLGLGIHDTHSRVLQVRRGADRELLEVFAEEQGNSTEAIIYFAIDRISDVAQMTKVTAAIDEVLADVAAVVTDHGPMLECLEECQRNLNQVAAENPSSTAQEALAFLEWLGDQNFTFLGCSFLEASENDSSLELVETSASRFGLLRIHPEIAEQLPCHSDCPSLQAFRDSNEPLVLGKTAVRSSVHRNAYIDAIYIKRLSPQGGYLGEYRFLGLYTSRIDHMRPELIPLVRLKVAHITERIGFEPASHDGKTLRNIFDTHPGEELFYCTEEQLCDIVIGIWQIKERRLVRLFLHGDPFENFVTCLLYMPRDLYHTRVQTEIDELLRHSLDAVESDYVTQFSESVLVRVFFRLRICSDRYRQVNRLALQERIARIARGWGEELLDAALDEWGGEHGRQLAQRYQEALPSSYREHFSPSQAIADIELCESLSDQQQLAVRFYRLAGNAPSKMRLKLLHRGGALELSNLMPILENLGFHVLGEFPYRLDFGDGNEIWIHDFSLRFELSADVDVPAVRQNFEEALYAIWRDATETDSFNRLVLAARLDWRAVFVLRAYARYLKQLGLSLSQDFIADTLANHVEITRNLVALFRSLFDLRLAAEEGFSQRVERLREKVIAALSEVESLSEERVILLYLELIFATQRTSFFQVDENQQPKPYVSFKFTPHEISAAPRPRPQFEIFVYSQRVEGVHLRMGKVARGGLRWSNRYEDYRTEVLGLMKAQQVKNAVILPAGAKGGFVAKRTLRMTNAKAIRDEGVACYQDFIRGLLDLTDNIINGEIVPPAGVVCRDDADPYLVVAADKGTAAFSDYANAISAEYDHWLGDAFASGGSEGYDHKEMGITARGAWIAVQRHFRQLDHDVQTQPLTVVGIGDMGGDVFGNGMLRSDQICLVGAFNHEHIFLDPAPDPATSFAERQRLFQLPRSRWTDYDTKLISEGGGVFARELKRIELSEPVRRVLDVDQDAMTPDELIAAILKAPVDLLWNGGIGTYVKASDETHLNVGDRANDSVRIDGDQLRCRVVGEGGNLGMTQKARIEYALAGGLCNTDFIDNSAGVDSSDHEVNIKIFLNSLLAAEDLTLKQRNQLLRDMTDEVAELVLENNYQQTGAIEQAYYTAGTRLDELLHFLHYLEKAGGLDRGLEFLPDDQALTERYHQGKGLTRPELAILTSYAKVELKEKLLQSSAPEDNYVARILRDAFPSRLYELYGERLYEHSLHRELIATQLANNIVDTMGMTFVRRQIESTGAGYRDVAMAWLTIRELFEFDEWFARTAEHDLQIKAECQRQIRAMLMRLGRRTTRWLLRNRRLSFDPANEVATLKPLLTELSQLLPEVLPGHERAQWQSLRDGLQAEGASEELSHFIASTDLLYFGMGAMDVATHTGQEVKRVMQFHFELATTLALNWFYEQVLDLEAGTRWQGLVREFYVDDLETILRQLVSALLSLSGAELSAAETVAEWQRCLEAPVARWLGRIEELRSAPGWDATMFAVALRDLQDLAELSEQTPAFCTFTPN